MFVSPQTSYTEILSPNVMVLGGRDFGRSLGHGGGALMNEISALSQRDPSCHVKIHSETMALYEPRSRSFPDTKSAST